MVPWSAALNMIISTTSDAYNLENIPFPAAADVQSRLSQKVASGESAGAFLFVQHPPVITLGNNALESHILSSPHTLASQGISIACADRGGGVTYHGPGQVLLYPIVRIRGVYSVRNYVALLQTLVTNTLKAFGLHPETRKETPGVWIGQRKISSIGIRIRDGIATHGLSLNVSGSLAGFDHITACNDSALEHTSIELESTLPIDCATAVEALKHHAEIVFERHLTWRTTDNHANLGV